MARFDIYRHPDASLRKSTPFLLDLQNNYIHGVDTRIVAPMRLARMFGLPMRDLNPSFEIAGTQVVMDIAALAAFPAADLRTPILNLQGQSDVIVDALDMLFGSY
ncbi:CcdB family protein [Variovorax sp. JS1663]|uniref:CcdB family protein n=1 Tax=Variovorax sp. JS1663 TaxID=1851577 RepID=UPI000B347E5D|nr:CcdB family protein [Variovorax sp. JS1663]OUM03915.1 plasmid maintenance protein CcdB [Variovorax sp. JS1663]